MKKSKFSKTKKLGCTKCIDFHSVSRIWSESLWAWRITWHKLMTAFKILHKPKYTRSSRSLSKSSNLSPHRACWGDHNFDVSDPLTINSTTFQSTRSNSFISNDFCYIGNIFDALWTLHTWSKSSNLVQNPFAHLHQVLNMILERMLMFSITYSTAFADQAFRIFASFQRSNRN